MRGPAVAALTIASALFGAAVNAGPAGRGALAVLHFDCGTSPAVCAAIESEVRSSLRHTGRFPLVESERIADVLREIARSHTRDFDQATAVEAGRMLAARYVCFGSVGPASITETPLEQHVGLRAYVAVSLRVVSVERDSLVFEATVTESQEGWRNVTPDDVLYVEAGKLAVREITRRFTNEVESRGQIVELMGDQRVLIDLGREHGVTKGTVLTIVRPGGVATSLDGQEVARPDVELGAIRVERVGPASSVARCLRGKPRPGDRVVSQQKNKSTWDW